MAVSGSVELGLGLVLLLLWYQTNTKFSYQSRVIVLIKSMMLTSTYGYCSHAQNNVIDMHECKISNKYIIKKYYYNKMLIISYKCRTFFQASQWYELSEYFRFILSACRL